MEKETKMGPILLKAGFLFLASAGFIAMRLFSKFNEKKLKPVEIKTNSLSQENYIEPELINFYR